jgi:hypothetical protein
MVTAADIVLNGFKIYYLFALAIDLFAAYKLATDHRFKKWKRYILAILIVPIPFVEWIYLGHLAYIKKGYFMNKLESILE